MVSDQTFDAVREQWFRDIPLQYRNVGKERSSNVNQHHLTTAIIQALLDDVDIRNPQAFYASLVDRP